MIQQSFKLHTNPNPECLRLLWLILQETWHFMTTRVKPTYGRQRKSHTSKYEFSKHFYLKSRSTIVGFVT